MKKMMAMIIALMMTASMVACGNVSKSTPVAEIKAAKNVTVAETTAATEKQTESETEEIENMNGGWEVNSSETAIDKNAEAKAAFEKALNGLVSADYVPLALLGTQVAAGTNYCIICKMTPVVPDAESTYELVYVYEDLDGNAEITGSSEIIGELADGGFTANEDDVSLEKNEDVKAAWNKVFESMGGVFYEAVAYLGSQVVAGTNYLVLCREKAVVPDAEPQFTLVTIYSDLDGNAEMLDSTAITLGENNEEADDSEQTKEQIPSPWAEYSSIEEAAQAAGIDIGAPNNLGDYKIEMLQSMSGLVEINYSDDTNEIMLRKGAGLDDISGNYNTYDNTENVTISDMTVTLKGNGDMINAAVWNDGTSSYAYYTESGVTSDTAQAHITEIIDLNK